jgi:flagellar protein FliS
MTFSRRAAHAYMQVGLETGVAAASPHRLILMLFDGALRALAEASSHLVLGDMARKGEAISRAISLIEDGLAGALDAQRGGSIAVQLRQLYEYMGRRLLVASMNNDVDGIAEVASLLGELRDAWTAIEPQPRTFESVAQQHAMA